MKEYKEKTESERQTTDEREKEILTESTRPTPKRRWEKRTWLILLVALASLVGWTGCSPVELERPEKSQTSTAASPIVSPEQESRSGNDAESDVAFTEGDQQSVWGEREDDVRQTSPSFEIERIASGERVRIERVVDGDTFIVHSSNGRERVRLVGANTPETVKKNWPVEPFGPEASAYTKRRVEQAGYVATLVTDGKKHDRYGRRLAFVYLGSDTVSIDEELVRNGLAEACLQYEFSREMKDKLAAAERLAKAENRGIHSLARNR